MLNIGKLASGGESYYLETVASGVEDYYTGSGEAPGLWAGRAAVGLGLSGRVDGEALRAVLGAADPTTGELLTGRMSRRKVPGFDCTFRAPKSVSLLYGLGDPDTSTAVRDAHDAAVTATLGYLEDAAGFSRRGHGGVERVKVGGFVAAAFRHRTSRAGDPLLHTHVLIANLGRAADDGRWRTLDGRSLYQHAKTAGYLYQVQLRAELTRRLGVRWGPVVNGCADLAGVPQPVIKAFSQRRTQILAHMDARGESSAKAAQVATLATRRSKHRTVEPAALGAEWSTRAAAVGFGPDQVAALTGHPVDVHLDPTMLGEARGRLVGAGGVTARASTFTRRDAIRAWCEQLPAGGDTGQVLALAAGLLADDAVVALDGALTAERGLSGDRVIRRGDGAIVPAEPDEKRFSTVDLLTVETRALSAALARRDAGVAVADPDKVTAALAARPSIGTEQATMVATLTGSGDGVAVVVGKAGAGKTFALDAARHAWQASGIPVIGCALAARAAAELQAGAGIDSSTIHALLADLDHPRHGGLAEGSVVVVDEAGMVGTRTLARLLDHAARADGKVVLVGDPNQLPEIDAGGLFAGLAARLPAVELHDNRRQHHQWERAALDELRHGDPTAALAAYQQAGRVVTGDSADAVRGRLVADWWTAVNSRPEEAGVMIAARRSDVDDLNVRARARMAAAGRLTGPALTTTGEDRQVFQAGDAVVCLRNDRRLGVVNGTRGSITHIDPDSRTVTVRTAQDKTVTLTAAYLDAGHLTHGYAITGHKAQGMTTDRAWVLGCDAMYRQWGYVALSRGRAENRLYLVTGHPSNDEDLLAPAGIQPTTADQVAAAGRALHRDRAQHLATNHTTGRPVDAGGVGSRLARLRQERDEAAAHAATAQRRLDTIPSPPGGLTGLLRRATAGDRAAGERERLRGDRDAWAARVADLDATIAELADQRQGHRPDMQPETAGGGQADRADVLRAVAVAEVDPPAHLLAVIGACPHSPAARTVWRRAAGGIEAHRRRWQITTVDMPLGEEDGPVEQQRERAAVARVIATARRILAVDNADLASRQPIEHDHDRSIGIR